MTNILVGSYEDFKLFVDKFKCDRVVTWSVYTPTPNGTFTLIGFNDAGTTSVGLSYNLGVGDPPGVVPPTLEADFPHAIQTTYPVYGR